MGQFRQGSPCHAGGQEDPSDLRALGRKALHRPVAHGQELPLQSHLRNRHLLRQLAHRPPSRHDEENQLRAEHDPQEDRRGNSSRDDESCAQPTGPHRRSSHKAGAPIRPHFDHRMRPCSATRTSSSRTQRGF
ncbi:hypothetical protein L596_029255 [Steinernema carpocapsae]|uniref:Uncharacterized protein n=1 Tax=Steinernema carpocapsae TaxID=34508 RepID=A0A4U5LU42_STECR|nr:hypothetical protein L596_029255 [Steinernema carpocapsae]